jgi:transcriptional regulator with XRE-family HTH domain
MAIEYNFDSIRIIRLSRNMNQAEFGRLVGVSRQDIRLWEEGHAPTIRNLAKIAQACGFSSLDIFFHYNQHYGNMNHDLSHAPHDTRAGSQ